LADYSNTNTIFINKKVLLIFFPGCAMASDDSLSGYNCRQSSANCLTNRRMDHAILRKAGSPQQLKSL
jgi:hypothetical protein